jgi:hypothetical protein
VNSKSFLLTGNNQMKNKIQIAIENALALGYGSSAQIDYNSRPLAPTTLAEAAMWYRAWFSAYRAGHGRHPADFAHGTDNPVSKCLEAARELIVAARSALPAPHAVSTCPYPEAGCARGASFVTRWSRGKAQVHVDGITLSDVPWIGCRCDGIRYFVDGIPVNSSEWER